ncbi:integrase arm-type DNA-binding domain-containing protein [Snodgrassella communis]|uniref:integrase arm-type DNA-binding domain-containing protein n=1 Tax=Snodgrassella communis TaxID=2946699 RepID=UPI001EF5043D|nr:integrase arm-type DNA-binding domain-containing protein [Snodgrassella communis]
MAGQTGKRLTDSKLHNIAPNSNQLTSSSVAGLVFKPSSCTKGTGVWILRYYDKFSKKRTKLTLRHYSKMGIASAEEEAKFLRAALKQGLNPKIEKQKAQDRERQKQLNTFKSISEEFFNKEKIMKCWKNQKSIDNWSDRMKKYVYPALADKPIIEINARDLTAILIAIWNTKT